MIKLYTLLVTLLLATSAQAAFIVSPGPSPGSGWFETHVSYAADPPTNPKALHWRHTLQPPAEQYVTIVNNEFYLTPQHQVRFFLIRDSSGGHLESTFHNFDSFVSPVLIESGETRSGSNGLERRFRYNGGADQWVPMGFTPEPNGLSIKFIGVLGMLVLSRKKMESIRINDNIEVVVIEIRGDKVRLGVVAPKEMPVHRNEVYEAIKRNQAPSPPAPTPSGPLASAGDSPQPAG